MLTSQWILQDGLTRLKNIDKQIKENTDIEPFKARMYGICYDMASATEELFFTLNSYRYKDIKERVLTSVKNVRESNDALDFKRNINAIVDMFEEGENFSHHTVSDFAKDKYDGAMKYSPINSINAEFIANAIKFQARPITLLDPRCRDGASLSAIKSHIPSAVAYGIEQEPNIADRAKSVLDKVAKGPLAGSRISNDTFDVMLLEPAISWNFTVQATGTFAKQEKEAFHNTIKYLRTDGLLIYVIPYFRLHKDICTMLARYLDDIQVRKMAGDDFYNKGLVVITGKKAAVREIDEEAYRTLRRLYNVDNLPTLVTSPFNDMRLPDGTIEVEFFRGSILDMEEMEAICSASGCMDSFWRGQAVEKLSENVKQPLLPFNIGQIGLVLTSGCLDGVVEEGDGHVHVIKGRVSKKTNTERDMLENGNIEVNETISNRVEIHVVMPNGEYKVLA